MENFIQVLNKGTIPEIVFVVAHFIGGLIFIQFIYKKRKQNPIIQNSPWLTIFAQLLLFFSSLCLLGSKIVLSIHNYETKYHGCLSNPDLNKLQYDWMIGISLVYLYCLEFVYITYFLKMIRMLLTVFDTEWFIYAFKREWALLLISGVWALLITSIDLLFKWFYSPKHRLELYPQIVTFMCDDSYDIYIQIGVQIFWYTREFLLLVPYLWSFWHSYRLQSIDEDVKLRKQYFALLSLPLISMIVTKIIRISDSFINYSILIHYVDCIINLIACFFLFVIHFRTPKNREFYLPDDKDLIGKQLDLSFLFTNKQSSDILAKYFESKHKQKLFQVKTILSDPSFDHKDITEERLNQILNQIEVENIKEQVNNNIDLKIKFTKAKNIMDAQIKQIISEWKKTVSYQTLQNKWKKNRKCYQKMMALNLVTSVFVPDSQISETQNKSNIKQQQKEQTLTLLQK